MNTYVNSKNDAVSLILGNLDDREYEKLVEGDFEELSNALTPFGEQFVLIDAIHKLTLKEDEYNTKTLQIVSFIYPKQYLGLYFEDNGFEPITLDSKEEVLEKLHDFINTVPMLTFEQADTINEIIEFYS